MSDYIVCETTAAIVTHLRRLADAPVRLSGHHGGPKTLCGKTTAWDTQHPVTSASCRNCRLAAGMSEVLR